MSVPDLSGARRLLCIQPHYDDNDLGAGGTIAALAEAGAHVCYLTVTDDLVGVLDTTLSDAEATRQLRAEQQQAGEAVGVAEHGVAFVIAGPVATGAVLTGLAEIVGQDNDEIRGSRRRLRRRRPRGPA